VSRFPEPADPNDWQPATSRPGELFTPEGQVRSVGAFARGLRSRDPRLREYRRSMRRVAFAFLGGLVAAFAVVIAVAALLR
jgi:hypothetical protein